MSNCAAKLIEQEASLSDGKRVQTQKKQYVVIAAETNVPSHLHMVSFSPTFGQQALT